MKDQKKCGLIQDLLPLYIDGLTSEGSTEQIREHLETCEDCKAVWQRMAEPDPQAQEAAQTESAEIDFFRKTKARGRRKLLAVILIAAVVLIAVLAVVFGRKKMMTQGEYTAEVTVTENGSASDLWIEGSLVDAYRIRETRFSEDENGIVHVDVLGSRSLFYGKDREFGFNCSLTAPPKQIWVGEQLVWENGENIPAYLSDLLASKTPYVGNNSAVMNLLYKMAFSQMLGSYHMRLQTSEEPYGMTVELDEQLNPLLQEYAEVKMKGYACMLLALVDNLGEASFEYTLNDGSEQVHRVTVTAQEAGELAGVEIKKAADSASGLKAVMAKLGLIEDYTS